jgi:hypothetical protein
LEDLLTREILQFLHHPRQFRVFKVDVVLDSAFATEVEGQPGSVHSDMPVAERRQPETAIGLGIFPVADARERGLKKADDRREDFLSRQSLPPEVSFYSCPNFREYSTAQDHAVVLAFIPRKAHDRLQMAVGMTAYPHILVGRRNRERADPGQRLLVRDRTALVVNVVESFNGALAVNSRRVKANVMQAGHGSGGLWTNGHVRKGF